MRKKALFRCTRNSARSQMAEGLLCHEAGDRFEMFSAGTNSTVRPEAVAVMSELGIDISHQRSKLVDEVKGQGSITSSPSAMPPAKSAGFPGKTRRLHWSFEDPAAVKGSYEQRMAAFRHIGTESSNGSFAILFMAT